MAKLTASSSSRLDTTNLPFLVSVKATLYTFTSWYIKTLTGDDYAVMYGKGIKGGSWQPISGGTITSISMYKNDAFHASLSGISVSAPKYFSWKTKSNREIGETFLAGSDSITGGSAGDLLNGFTGSDRIYGGSGRDQVIGGSGNDTLRGEAGRDTLTGGSGSDKFVFDTEPMLSNVDRITDFTRREDLIQLSRSTFNEIGLKGALKPGHFCTGTAAQDATDRVIYNKKTGVLSFDPDGSGPLKQTAFATVDKGLALSAKDFYIL